MGFRGSRVQIPPSRLVEDQALQRLSLWGFFSDGAGSPRLVLVREPDQLGVERAHPQLAFGVRLVEFAEPNRHVAAHDNRTRASLDDDHLHSICVARRRDEPEPGKQFELAVDRHVPHARRIDPLTNRVVVLAARVVELPTLDVDRPAGEEVVATTVVEVQVCVDDDVNAGEVEVLLAQWKEAGIKIGHRRVQLRHAGVDQHTRIGMVDDVHVDRHPLALDEQLGHEDGRDGGRRRHLLRIEAVRRRWDGALPEDSGMFLKKFVYLGPSSWITESADRSDVIGSA